MKVYVIFVLILIGFVASSATDQLNDKKSISKPEKMEPSEETRTLNLNKSEQQSEAQGNEVASELSGTRRINGRKQKADTTDNFSLDENKDQPAENSILSDEQTTIDLFNKYLEKYGAEMKNNKGLTFEDLLKHLEKDELMLLTKAYDVLANGHGNLVKKLKEHALTTTTTTTTTKPPIYQSKSLRYRPIYKKLSSKQTTKQDPTLFFINNGHIYSIKRHS